MRLSPKVYYASELTMCMIKIMCNLYMFLCSSLLDRYTATGAIDSNVQILQDNHSQ